MTTDLCPLCFQHKTDQIAKDKIRIFYRCLNCQFIFVPAKFHLSVEESSKRYHYHQNNPNDTNYRQFLEIVLGPLRNHLPDKKCLGLDYGSGAGRAVSAILELDGHTVLNYDPLFSPLGLIDKKKFDFVTCTEVVEHFLRPKEDWDQLIEVSKSAILGIMTHLNSKQIDFSNWYYKNDPTHVAFYSKETLEYIAGQKSLEILEIKERYALFKVL